LSKIIDIRDGNSIYLVRATKNKIQSISPQAISRQKNKKPAAGGMDPELVTQLLDNPFVQSVMSNPVNINETLKIKIQIFIMY